MDAQAESLVKRREIAFCTLHPDPDQASTAATLLVELEGVLHVEVRDRATLHIHYHLLAVCLADIEDHLVAQGFNLDSRLLHKLRRALYRYTEETQRANLGCARGESNCTQKIFANSYRQREHGCQDDRPEHWRHYL
jgi:hypothetical protein